MPVFRFGTKMRCPALCETFDAPGVLAWPVDMAQETPCNRRAST